MLPLVATVWNAAISCGRFDTANGDSIVVAARKRPDLSSFRTLYYGARLPPGYSRQCYGRNLLSVD